MSSEDEKEGLFRKKSLERISSPEQLDKLMVVIGSKGWLAIWCLIFLIAAALVWAFFGKIPVQVNGLGIILTEQGLFSVQTPVGGVVLDIYVKSGDLITKNTLIAKLNDQELTAKLRQAEQRVKSLEEILQKLKLKDKGNQPLIQPIALALKRQLDEASTLIRELEAQSFDLEIYSSADGQILEINIAPGDIIKPGQLIAWLNLPLKAGETFLCYAFLPINEGEKVKPGMPSEIALANVDTETYGYLLGEVQNISLFPISDHEMVQRVRNPQLVAYLKQGQPAVIAAIIKPSTDSATPSGYKWSSAKGPPYPIKAGTTCSIHITTEIRRPISYLFPFFNTNDS